MNAERRKKADRTILIIFGVFALLTFVLSIGLSPFVKGATISTVASWILAGLTLSSLAAGFWSFLSYRRSALTPRRRLLVWVTALSVLISVIISVITILVIDEIPDSVELPDLVGTPLADQLPQVFVFLMVTLIPSFIIVILLFMVVAFGVVGVMSAFVRRATPWLLNVIVRSGGKTDLPLQDRVVRWFFAIPDTLDARTLSIKPSVPKVSVSRPDLMRKVLWQLFFGAILAIYVSLNPFLSDRSPDALLGIFAALTSAASLIPFLILPWFIYGLLDARIKGLAKDFRLLNGLRARFMQSFVAIGTIVILIRLAISEIDVQTYLIVFSTFMLALFAAAFTCTFVYLNNFENGLAEDVSRAFVKGDASEATGVQNGVESEGALNDGKDAK